MTSNNYKTFFHNQMTVYYELGSDSEQLPLGWIKDLVLLIYDSAMSEFCLSDPRIRKQECGGHILTISSCSTHAFTFQGPDLSLVHTSLNYTRPSSYMQSSSYTLSLYNMFQSVSYMPDPRYMLICTP